jgi:hypothetical protein
MTERKNGKQLEHKMKPEDHEVYWDGTGVMRFLPKRCADL